MSKLKISAVSYLNSRPFLYGLEQAAVLEQIQLSLDMPAQAADKLLNDEVDISLVPVAIIPQLENPKIISPYCIGADGEVLTVSLFSNVPLEEIKTVYLDYQSRTSVQLVRVLFREYWKKEVVFAQAHPGFESELSGTTAGVIIGDRCINFLDKYPFVFDLAGAWKSLTGLPFVFAVWLSKNPIHKKFAVEFNTALKYGLDHRSDVIVKHAHLNSAIFSVEKYLSENIQYDLDAPRKKALMQFLGYMCADDRCRIPNVEFYY
jgi:chorismate dehydratase